MRTAAERQLRLWRYTASGRALCLDQRGLRVVVERPELSPAPGAPDWLTGAANHHGRAIAVVDVNTLLGIGAPLRQPPCVLLVESGGHILGLTADGPPLDFRADPFTRRGHVLEVADRRTDLLWIDLARLHTALADALAMHGAV